MPCYEYLTREGRRVDHIRSIAQRDELPPGCVARVTVPAKLHYVTGLRLPTQEQNARTGLRDLEVKRPGFDFKREMGWSAKQLKQIWADDQPRKDN